MTEQQDSSLSVHSNGMSRETSSSSCRSARSSADSGIFCDHGYPLSSSGDSNSHMIPILENAEGAVCDQEETEKVKEEKDKIFTTGSCESNATADSDKMIQRHSVATNTSDELDSTPLPLADDCGDNAVIPRTRSLPATELKSYRRTRWERSLSFTGTSGSSNEPVIVQAKNGHKYEGKRGTGIYSPSPSPSPSTSRMELAESSCSPTRRNMVHRASQTDNPIFQIKSAEDSSTPTEETIVDAIKQHSDKFSQWINWNELAIYLEKYGLLDSESRTNLLNACTPVSSRKSHYFLYQVLPTKGFSPYSLFFKALDEEKHHRGHTELVSLIREHQNL